MTGCGRKIGPFDCCTVVCCDCLEAMKQLPDGCVDAVITDIPYGAVNRSDGGLRNLNKRDADVVTFELDKLTRLFCRISSGSSYVFCGTEQVSTIRAQMVWAGMTSRLCVWEKTNPSPMNGDRLWLSSIEACVFGRWPKAHFSEFCASPVWRFPVEREQEHPTQKPIELMARIVAASTADIHVVLDPFAGSGTTLVAAKKLGRHYLGFEINVDYVQIARNRLDRVEAQPSLFEQKPEQLGLVSIDGENVETSNDKM